MALQYADQGAAVCTAVAECSFYACKVDRLKAQDAGRARPGSTEAAKAHSLFLHGVLAKQARFRNPGKTVSEIHMEGHLQAGGDGGLIVAHVQRPLDVALALAGLRVVLLSRDGARAERGRPGDLGGRQLYLRQVLEEGLPICMAAPQAVTPEVQACIRAPCVFSWTQH